MNYDLSQHAIDAIAKRNIAAEWLERALDAPQRVVPDAMDEELEHRIIAIPELGGRVLRVVVNAHRSPIRIATAYIDRKLRGRL